MAFVAGERTQIIRVPYRLIDKAFGPGNSDDAGDFMVDGLRELSDYPTQYAYRFREDLTHVNPWYYVLEFAIDDIPNTLFQELLALLVARGMTPD